ncbi:hypothetical protein [Embleya sp. NBC_00896]|uniref:hypothetical protein n=1 Tax=Embleya sp. NBC_00896 TaxID=2975961 RepID=UPI002F9164C8|nr:hypothetical protein OG928_48150 [Embleya sp. NBC_00896]
MNIVTASGQRWMTLNELDRLTTAAGEVAQKSPGLLILRSLPDRDRLTPDETTDVIHALVAIQSRHATGKTTKALRRIAADAAIRLHRIKRPDGQVDHLIGTGAETRKSRKSRKSRSASVPQAA